MSTESTMSTVPITAYTAYCDKSSLAKKYIDELDKFESLLKSDSSQFTQLNTAITDSRNEFCIRVYNELISPLLSTSTARNSTNICHEQIRIALCEIIEKITTCKDFVTRMNASELMHADANIEQHATNDLRGKFRIDMVCYEKPCECRNNHGVVACCDYNDTKIHYTFATGGSYYCIIVDTEDTTAMCHIDDNIPYIGKVTKDIVGEIHQTFIDDQERQHPDIVITSFRPCGRVGANHHYALVIYG